MKRYILIFMGLLCPFISFSQEGAVAQKMTLIRTSDCQTGELLPFANIRIIDLKRDSMVVAKGMTDTSGLVRLVLKDGRYMAEASFLGYSTARTVPFSKSSDENDPVVIEIKLQKNSHELKQVNIRAEKRIIESIPGGYRFNVEKTIAKSGNLLELLRQVPGLTVDGANSIKLQGRGPAVLINGRRVTMSGSDLEAYLKSVSASQVSDIDVLTTPGAGFDADGEGGILNIKLKRHDKPGLYGQVSTNLSTLLSTDNGANINFRQNKLEVSASYSNTYREDYYKRNIRYENLSLPDSLYRFNQDQRADRTQNSSFAKGGLAYAIDSTGSLSFNFFGAWYRLHSPTRLTSDIFNRRNEFQNRYFQQTQETTNNRFYIYDVLYKKTFGKKNEIGAGLNYSSYDNRMFQSYTRTFSDANGVPVDDRYNDNRMVNTLRPYRLFAANMDYLTRLSAQTKLELGAKYATTNTSSVFINTVYDKFTQQSLMDSIVSNNIRYAENTFAAYAIFSGKLNHISYQFGMRYEDFGYRLSTPSLDQAYSNHYGNLFPSVNLSYTNDQKTTYSLNFGRRIQRPGYSLLNPFLNVVTLGQYQAGNPYLQPYFVNKIELQQSRRYGNGNYLMLSLFASASRNLFSQLFKYNPAIKMNYDTYDNFRNLKQLGIYMVWQQNVRSWLNLSAYVAGTQSTFSSKIPEDVLFSENLSFTGNLSLNFSLIKAVPLQIYGYVVTQNKYFQARNAINGNISMALQHKLLKKKLTASVNIEDLFNLNCYETWVNSAIVNLRSANKVQSQFVRIGFSYNFGKSFDGKAAKELKKDSRID